ncbi:hypothetical protein BH11MYX3_BH11MYX3_25200 [soil metagenome]
MPPRLLASTLALSLLGCGASRPPPMALRRVILYQNGIGYFERTGQLKGGTLRLSFARTELDDVLKTLTVIDRIAASGVATVDVPTPGDKDRTIAIDVRLASRRAHDLLVGYAVPTPTWKAAYRVVLDDGKRDALLQGWAMINNTSQEDWHGVQLTLATGAPMSFAHDLHTPEYVKRPNTSGHLVAPTVLGPIDPEVTGAADTDHDGVLDSVDRCPDAAEDRDGFSDDDGCPDSDSDGDRISDQDDKCPDSPESYNGYDDTDGCPDRGRVVTTDSQIMVLEAVSFDRDTEVLTPASRATVDAVATTLIANPEIRLLEIGGHASTDETEAWGLSARRAEVVRAAIVAKGVSPDRLSSEGYGSTSPRNPAKTLAALATNRRVEFLILKRSEDGASASTSTRIDTTTAAASTHTRTTAAAVAGTVRYVLGEPVTVRRGGSTMVSILNKPIQGEDTLLFRPDGNAPGSDRHPFRAVRLHNSSGFTLEPGPIAIFAGGSFVGDSLLKRLDLGQTAWIPYAVDGSTGITTDRDDAERPVRLLAMQRGVMTVENAGVHTTRYTIATGLEPTHTIYVRHAKTAGYTPTELPPGTQDQGDAYLVPLPLSAGRTSILTIEEREPRKRTVALLDAKSTELGVYLEGAALSKELSDRMAEAIALRKDMGALEEELAARRDRISDITSRTSELRETIKSLDKVRGANELKKKLVASLTAAIGDSDAVARQIGSKTEALAVARNRLQLAIRELTLEPNQ